MTSPSTDTNVSIDLETAMVAMSALQRTAVAAHVQDQLDGRPGFRGRRDMDGSESSDRFITAHHAIADAIDGGEGERMFALGCSSEATPESISEGVELAKFLIPFWISRHPNHGGKIPPAAAQTLSRVLYELTFLSATSSRSVLATAAKAHGLELMSMRWSETELTSSINN